MPKMKTRSGAKKRFRVTATGKLRHNVAYKRHGLVKRSQKMKRQARGTAIVAAGDARLIRQYMP